MAIRNRVVNPTTVGSEGSEKVAKQIDESVEQLKAQVEDSGEKLETGLGNVTTAIGDLAAALFGGGLVDKYFMYDQGVPSSVWTINHNLAKYPAVMVVDTSNSVVEGQINYVDNNNLTITFAAGFAGKAYLN